MKCRKDEIVVVTPAGGAPLYEAIIRKCHRDGSATVEARFFLAEDGARRPGYLGYRYRVDQQQLSAA